MVEQGVSGSEDGKGFGRDRGARRRGGRSDQVESIFRPDTKFEWRARITANGGALGRLCGTGKVGHGTPQARA